MPPTGLTKLTIYATKTLIEEYKAGNWDIVRLAVLRALFYGCLFGPVDEILDRIRLIFRNLIVFMRYAPPLRNMALKNMSFNTPKQ